MRVAHLPLYLGPRRKRGHGVDDEHVEGAGADEHVGDLQRLLPRVGLGDEQLVDVDPYGPGVHRVHGVLGVDVGADASVALGLRHHVHGQRRLSRGLGAEDLHDAAPRQSADSQGQVERHGPRGDGLHLHVRAVAHPHDRALAELLLDLAQSHVEGLVSFHRSLPLLEHLFVPGDTLRMGCDSDTGVLPQV